MSGDYPERGYLSVQEAARHTGFSVSHLHRLVQRGNLSAFRSSSGQYRFALTNLKKVQSQLDEEEEKVSQLQRFVQIGESEQRIICGDSRDLSMLADGSIHLAVTSPPYFNAKMYSDGVGGDLGNVHDLDMWLFAIGKVWGEVFRVLQPGRKFFLNIMNLPVRYDKTFRALNLIGKTIDLCESVGFVFKRDIIWHKTNGVRGHFGTFPYPGGILLNMMHESILEFEKSGKSQNKYGHVTKAQKERSKLSKDFWLSLKNTDVWLMKPEKSGASRSHIAPFPLELPERLIRAYSYVGERVLDPFLGSGTTLLAAALHARNGVGIDIHDDFCQMAYRRLQEEGSLVERACSSTVRANRS